ncbi:hypothetical protein [Tuberibacillus sp. Marseille-P3662]|uniref:hypothetical protein n=1 Tax=Tuberibacillus sp. Marseille-P3662 TaxID=1965358 RepID=UPI0020CAADB8|nr:hypothetical protein [Tuberibacillus sp. Marseille-P3662]
MSFLIKLMMVFAVPAWFLYVFNKLMGYRKGNITIDLDNWYTDFDDHIEAVKQELGKQGRTVTYQHNRHFIIDGKSYILMKRDVPMGGAPLQRTILQYQNESHA